LEAVAALAADHSPPRRGDRTPSGQQRQCWQRRQDHRTLLRFLATGADPVAWVLSPDSTGRRKRHGSAVLGERTGAEETMDLAPRVDTPCCPGRRSADRNVRRTQSTIDRPAGGARTLGLQLVVVNARHRQPISRERPSQLFRNSVVGQVRSAPGLLQRAMGDRECHQRIRARAEWRAGCGLGGRVNAHRLHGTSLWHGRLQPPAIYSVRCYVDLLFLSLPEGGLISYGARWLRPFSPRRVHT